MLGAGRFKHGETLCCTPQGGSGKRGCSWVRCCPTWTPSAVAPTDGRTVASSLPLPPCVIASPLFQSVLQTQKRGCDGSRPSRDEGWGSSRRFQSDANDLCTIQGQRMICEACAPTHTSTHNLVLDYISI